MKLLKYKILWIFFICKKKCTSVAKGSGLDWILQISDSIKWSHLDLIKEINYQTEMIASSFLSMSTESKCISNFNSFTSIDIPAILTYIFFVKYFKEMRNCSRKLQKHEYNFEHTYHFTFGI